jgi:hypothetical protein
MSKYDASTHTTSQNNDHANQYNPNNSAYDARMNNHSDQLNPNNERFAGDDADNKHQHD